MKKEKTEIGKIILQTDTNSSVDGCKAITDLYARGQYAEAAQLARSMTERFPHLGSAWMMLGLIFLQMGRSEDALVQIENAVALMPDNPEARNNLGVVLRSLGRFEESDASCRHALQLKPDYAEACCNLGMTLHKLGRFDESEQFHRRAVALDAQSAVCRFNLANFLAVSDRSRDREEAKSLYLAMINMEPTHLGAWSNLGRLLFETRYTSAACTAYTAAVTYHPREAIAHVNLGNVLLDMGNLSLAAQHFDAALELNSALTTAHQGLASIWHRLGNEDKSRFHRDLGFGNQPLSTQTYRGRNQPVQLLVLASALEGNIPWRLLIDNEVFHTTIVAVEYFGTRQPLPPHQLVFNAIGDADLCRRGLEIALELVAKSKAPVLNHPGAVLQTGRLANAGRIGGLSRVIVPRIALVSRSDLISAKASEILAYRGFSFPLLLRASGFHGGNYFVCMENADAMNAAIEELPGESILVIELLDSRSEDKLFRKYRVMSINGVLYPLHMAISAQWKVHYFSSDMVNCENFRIEEQVFLNDFSAFLGSDAIMALEKISGVLGLDYCGIDFGMDKNGNILLFEANATMALIPPTHEEKWAYKRKAFSDALEATRSMFRERAVTSN